MHEQAFSVCVVLFVVAGVEVTLETYHDKEGIDRAASNDDKCISSLDQPAKSDSHSRT